MSDWEIKKMEWILLGIGLILGGGIGFGISKATEKKPEPIVDNSVAEGQQEVIKNLTNLDLVLPICNPKKDEESVYSSLDQALMCRYLSCLQFSRGIDSKTGGNGECEAISNIMNKKAVLEICKKEDSESSKICIEFFDRRL